jgi:hypothetical protein
VEQVDGNVGPGEAADGAAERASAYARVAQTFWESYAHSVDSAAGPIERVEAHTVRELGCLLLARIDGKSKVEYITDDRTKEAIRKRAREILLGNEQRLKPLIKRIDESHDSGSTRTIE